MRIHLAAKKSWIITNLETNKYHVFPKLDLESGNLAQRIFSQVLFNDILLQVNFTIIHFKLFV